MLQRGRTSVIHHIQIRLDEKNSDLYSGAYFGADSGDTAGSIVYSNIILRFKNIQMYNLCLF